MQYLRRFAAFDSLRMVLGIVLFIAAMLKAQRLWQVGAIDDHSKITAVEIAAETAVAIVLTSGLFPVASFWISLSTFSILECGALWKLFKHESTCSCFGLVQFSPQILSVFDGLAIIAILYLRPTTNVAQASHLFTTDKRIKWESSTLFFSLLRLLFSAGTALVASTFFCNLASYLP